MRLSKHLRYIPSRLFADIQLANANHQIIEKAKSKELPYKQFQTNFNFPLKIGGMKNIQEDKPSFMFNQMLNYAKISKTWILDHLLKIYLGTLYSMEKGDKEFLEEYLGPLLASKMLEQLSELNNKGYKVN